jgi:DNA polymerase I - 3''-5'' exonuclease and polymerase domains
LATVSSGVSHGREVTHPVEHNDAFLYGAGDQKLGSIVAPTASPARQAQIGKRLKSKFFAAIPAIKALIDDVQNAVKKRPFLYGIDKRKLHVRSSHSALNTLLQSAGAILVKFATIVCHHEAELRYGWRLGVDYTQVLHVHKNSLWTLNPVNSVKPEKAIPNQAIGDNIWQGNL